MLIKVLNSVTKTEKEVTEQEFNKIVKLGMLRFYQEIVSFIRYEEKEVFKNTFYFLKSINKLDKKTKIEEMTRVKLIKESRAFYKPIKKRIRNLKNIVKETIGLKLTENLELDLLNCIKEVKGNKDSLKSIKVPLNASTSSYPIRDKKEVKKQKKVKIQKQVKIPETYVQQVFTKIFNVERDEDCYYGTLFPLSYKNKKKLIEFKKSLTNKK